MSLISFRIPAERFLWPVSVTRMVCSHCADRLWSLVTMVQPSANARISARPALIMGSMVKVMPSRSSMPVPANAVIEGGSGLSCDNANNDCHLLVVQGDTLYEAYRANAGAGSTLPSFRGPAGSA